MVEVSGNYFVIYKHFVNEERNYDFKLIVLLCVIKGPLKLFTAR